MKKIIMYNDDYISLINPANEEICHIKIKNNILYVEEIEFKEIINLAIQEKTIKKENKINNDDLENYIEKYINKYYSKK